MSERLTDAELTHLEMFGANDVLGEMSHRIWSVIDELREHRAAESAKFDARVVVMNDDGKMRRVFLTGREVESLDWLVKHLKVTQMEGVPPRAARAAALSTLDKLLSGDSE